MSNKDIVTSLETLSKGDILYSLYLDRYFLVVDVGLKYKENLAIRIYKLYKDVSEIEISKNSFEIYSIEELGGYNLSFLELKIVTDSFKGKNYFYYKNKNRIFLK